VSKAEALLRTPEGAKEIYYFPHLILKPEPGFTPSVSEGKGGPKRAAVLQTPEGGKRESYLSTPREGKEVSPVPFPLFATFLGDVFNPPARE
jgi:hypothetical protein